MVGDIGQAVRLDQVDVTSQLIPTHCRPRRRTAQSVLAGLLAGAKGLTGLTHAQLPLLLPTGRASSWQGL